MDDGWNDLNEALDPGEGEEEGGQAPPTWTEHDKLLLGPCVGLVKVRVATGRTPHCDRFRCRVRDAPVFMCVEKQL